MNKKVWLLPANEDWICDRIVNEFNHYNQDIITLSKLHADIIWLYSDWCWRQVSSLFYVKKVLCTVHHITPEKFNHQAELDFVERDKLVDAYHVYNFRTEEFIKDLTDKPIHLIPYWCNQYIWKITDSKESLRQKFNLPKDSHIIGSFQRDTEGSDQRSPKLEKGPDILADYIIDNHKDSHVLLAGWRRQYIIKRLKDAGVSFTYIERPSQDVLNELYQTLDLYVVAARHEGGPQSLLECGLLNVPMISTPVGIAEQVLPKESINLDLSKAIPNIPNVDQMKIPIPFKKYRDLLQTL